MDGRIQTRIPLDTQITFEEKCKELKRDHNVVIREMVVAFNEDRLKITPTDAQRKLYEH